MNLRSLLGILLLAPTIGWGAARASDTDVWFLTREAEKAMRAQLRDPGSAKVRNEVVTRLKKDDNDPGFVCGEVNAKNGFGGYTDFEPFVYWNGHVLPPDFLKSRPDVLALCTAAWDRAK